MLGFFVKLGEDETLYGGLSRQAAVLGGPAAGPLLTDCFGSLIPSLSEDLPGGIMRLVSRIPGGTNADAAALIDEHTSFPYFHRFAPSAFADRTRRWMLTGEGMRPARFGVLSATIRPPQHLRFCRRCASEDSRRDLGVPLWRRAHQLPGVFICPTHAIALHEAAVHGPREAGRRHELIALTEAVIADARPCNVPPRTHGFFGRVACGSREVLKADTPVQDLAALQARLRDLLSDFRWSRAPSLMASAEFVSRFLGHEAIRQLGDLLQATWTEAQIGVALHRLLYKDAVAKHPLFVLLVLELAGASIEDLMAPPSQSTEAPQPCELTVEPPSQSDLPCGSPVCSRYQGRDGALTACQMTGADSVTVRCSACGFAYKWDARRPKETVLVETSPEWDQALARLVGRPNTSLRSLARDLGVSGVTVKRHARRLGLWQPEWNPSAKVRGPGDDRAAKLLATHRREWSLFRATGLVVPIKQMPTAAFNAYRYLNKHDREWLAANPVRTRPRGQRRVDWEVRDQEWADRAREIISEWRREGKAGRPSWWGIGRALGRASVIMGAKERLPKLAEVIRGA